MPGKVIGTTLNNGFPGSIARSIDEIIETFPNEGDTSIDFGAPVVLGTNKGVTAFPASATADTDFVGVACRIVKTNETYGEDDAAYLPKDPVPVIKRGGVSVKAGGSPAKGGDVYVDPSTGKFTAESTRGSGENTENNVKITNAKFGSAADGNGIATLILLTRKL